LRFENVRSLLRVTHNFLHPSK